jgi:hypothetical protein
LKIVEELHNIDKRLIERLMERVSPEEKNAIIEARADLLGRLQGCSSRRSWVPKTIRSFLKPV